MMFDFKLTKEAYVNSRLTARVALSKKLKKNKISCYYDQCGKTAIKSHTVSKESCLRRISENGKVLIYKPEIKDKIIQLVPREIGIDDASSFFGFCLDHEKLFCSVDQNGITTLRDAMLQSYRCLAKWLDNDRISQAYADELSNSLGCLFHDAGRQVINKQQSARQDIPYAVTRVMYESLGNILTKSIAEEEFNVKPCNEITPNLMLLHHHLDYQLPLAMNARNLITFTNGDEYKTFCIFCIIIPGKEDTEVLVLLDGLQLTNISGVNVRDYWVYLCTNEIPMLEYIETIMMSCEEWCIRPSVIHNLSPLKKENIDFDLRHKCFNSMFYELIHYTIFEDIWKALIVKESNEEIKKEAEKKNLYCPNLPTEKEIAKAERDMSDKIYQFLR